MKKRTESTVVGRTFAVASVLLRGTKCTCEKMDLTKESGLGAEVTSAVRWFALTTRARHEKRVDSRLQERGLESYLPLRRQVRQWHDRKKEVQLPLFPSYIFARVYVHDLVRALSTPGVASVVRLNGSPVPIRDEEIENVRRFARAINETGLEPEPVTLISKGERARVLEGPFRGVEGVVHEQRGQGRVLLVGLPAIGQGLKVEVDSRNLKVVGEVGEVEDGLR